MAVKHTYAHRYINQGLFEHLSSFQELEKRISELPTNNERGSAFEVFAEAYLATQRIVQAEQVWPDQSVPLEILSKLSLPLKDMGADGVFRSLDGNLNAYQVKYRSDRTSLTWEELGTFMGLTDQVDQRVLFTNSESLPSVINERSKFFCIRGNDLDRLTTEDFQTINEWLKSGRIVVKQKTPHLHQAEALEAITKGLNENNRATAVMACGAGKTLVALWVAESMNFSRVIVLVPSLALVRQTIHEWVKETKWQKLRFICVCSDSTVTRGADELIVKQSDIDFPVTTDSAEIRKFLSNDSGDIQVVFSTYQSSRVVAEAVQGLPAFELGIFDEAHKTAGRDGTNFGFALSDKNLEIKKRLFLTATPRHYDIAKKDKEGEAKEVFSMDVPEVYGPRVYTLPFAEAARRGIICDYKVIISVITSEMVNEELLKYGEVLVEGDIVRARQVANQIALQKACEEHDLKKVFTFHTRVESARDFTGEGGQSVASHLPQYKTLHISGDMPTARREMIMKTFKESERAIISNARCLTEGVDVPAVDMVAFISPKKSKVDIIQATGRAMRKADGKKVGYVMVPLYLEQAKDESIEEAVARTDLGDIWDVLQAMKEQDDVLEDIIRQLRIEKGRSGVFDESRTRERIEVLGPEISVDDLRRYISISIIDRLGVVWDERYGQLLRYKELHGNCNVPRDWPENPRLSLWVKTQRKLYNNGRLTSKRYQLLREIGFLWNPHDQSWEEGFAALVAFRSLHGHCIVPDRYPSNQVLANWVKVQRRAKLKGEIDPFREQRLNQMNFIWDPFDVAWEKKFSQLEQYKRRYGNCDVPQSYADNPPLGVWVQRQRMLATQEKLEISRIERLSDIGFEWEPEDARWNTRFNELVEFKAEHGHCNVPGSWTKNKQLAKWVTHRRSARLRGTISREKVRQLDEIGFDWNPIGSIWEQRYLELEAYKKQFGDCMVPAKWPANPELGAWVRGQRRLITANKLSSDRLARLITLGFETDPLTVQWERKFHDLEQFKNKYGHCNVPGEWKANPELSNWVSVQRSFKRKQKLDAEKIQKLTQIGFDWDPIATVWEQRYSELAQYKETYGHCNVPPKWPDNRPLGAWVSAQRLLKTRNKIETTKLHRLTQLGFNWDPVSTAWEKKFNELKQYKLENNNCDVKAANNRKLASWVSNQRSAKKKGKLDEQQIAKLTEIGFRW